MTEYRLMDGLTPAFEDAGDTGTNIVLGTRFHSSWYDGYIVGLRFWKSADNTGTHTGHLWTDGATHLAAVTFENETASGWQYAYFATPVAIDGNTIYVISYFCPNGHYAMTGNFFDGQYAATSPGAVLRGSDANEVANGTYDYLESGWSPNDYMPNNTYNKSNYFVDPIWSNRPTAGGGPSIDIVVFNSDNTEDISVLSPVPYAWDGTDWVLSVPKVWNGTDWVELGNF